MSDDEDEERGDMIYSCIGRVHTVHRPLSTIHFSSRTPRITRLHHHVSDEHRGTGTLFADMPPTSAQARGHGSLVTSKSLHVCMMYVSLAISERPLTTGPSDCPRDPDGRW